MPSLTALIAVLQVIAAFMIYLVSFLAVFVFVILSLVTLVFLYRGADFVWAYTVKSNLQDLEVSSEAKQIAGGLQEPRQRIHHPFSGVSLFRSHR
jgi:predicted membrane protein